jgi:hypothetical protein
MEANERREQRISNGSPSSGSILPLKLLLVILWKRNGGRDQRENQKKE